MTNECWNQQKARLIDRFGKVNFSSEFSLLAAIECSPLPDQAFVSIVNFMIGSRKHNSPPLLQDFRDARLAYDKRKFDYEVRDAANVWNNPANTLGLKGYLAKEFPGCKSLADAVEVRKLQIQIECAKNPHYDPMCDRKWMGEHAWEPREQS